MSGQNYATSKTTVDDHSDHSHTSAPASQPSTSNAFRQEQLNNSGHSHAHGSHDHGHDHAPAVPTRRPMTGLDHDDLQPHGNAAAQEDAEDSQFGDSVFDYSPSGILWHVGKELYGKWVDYREETWWERYSAANEGTRQEMAHDAWQEGSLQTKIDALSEAQTVEDSGYRMELGEVLDYLQQFEMMRASGKTWEEMAETQSDYMIEEARQRIQAENPDAPPPTDEELQQAHEDSVADQDYLAEEDSSWWDGLSDEEQTNWNRRGSEAVEAFVAYAHRAHPELNVSLSEIGVDIPGNSNSVAYVDGNRKCWIGQIAIENIERNPAYATSTVMHELRGHPEFDTGFSLSMELYNAAAADMPGYTKPAPGSDEQYDEWTRFEYFESEIGALMREETFWVPSQDLNGDGVIDASEENTMGSPQSLLDTLLSNLAGQFAPELQAPFVTGLARRFEADPRVRPSASAMFAEACQRLLGVTP